METAMMNSICRCCATEGVFKCVTIAYTWMGEEEIYADMLKECFDINLNLSESGEDGGICEVCITQLRNASNFKKQVLSTEEQLKKHAENKLFKPNIVKVEVTRNDDDSDDNMSAEEAYSGPEFEVPIKTETEESKPKKRTMATRASTSGAKKSKDDDAGETSTKRNEPEPSMIEIEVDTSCMITDEVAQNVKYEVEKHRENIRTILFATNATPFGRYSIHGYACCFCSEQYTDPKDLKTHTQNNHNEENISKFMKNFTMINYIVKLDITELRCNICTASIVNLNEMIDHLTIAHGKFFYTDIKSHIIPFRFGSKKPKCVECLCQFNNFKSLLEHMNSHYSNHVCEVCKAGFVNRRMLQAHMYRHQTGEFRCSFCSKIYDTRINMKVHERVVHMHVKKKTKCTVCDMKFKDFSQVLEHETNVHGLLRREYECKNCTRLFSTEKDFLTHNRYCT